MFEKTKTLSELNMFLLTVVAYLDQRILRFYITDDNFGLFKIHTTS